MHSRIANFLVIVLCCAPCKLLAQLGTINHDPRPINGAGYLAFDTATHTLYGTMSWPDWNGSTDRIWQLRNGQFSSVGGGLGSPPTSGGLVVYADDLFYGGTLGSWNAGYDIDHLGRWNGTVWEGSGEPNAWVSLFTSAEDLWCHGAFDSLGGQPASSYLLRLVNDAWEPFGGPMPEGMFFRAAAYFQGSYYFGGNFIYPWPFEDIVRWDGTVWQSVAGGLVDEQFGELSAMSVFQGKLYVAGLFWNPGDFTRNIKVWDGTAWQGFFPDLVASTTGAIEDMRVIANKLYITGCWRFANDDREFAVLIYDGEELCGLGVTPYGSRSHQITGNADTVFFGTTEYILSGDTVNYYALWPTANGPDTCVPLPTSMRERMRATQVQVYPNPTEGELTVELPTAMHGPIDVRVMDALGREVLRQRMAGGSLSRVVVNAGALPAGSYTGQLLGGSHARFRFIKR